ncbi:UPAR/Ly6 domain-containing protein bou [Eurosta solidaginis]|uniref:UPAR/Ly6 domain-containing protein bou n=1 Tax=Eurosta solidaginis TaxID=178769 RepID=UPI003530CBD4
MLHTNKLILQVLLIAVAFCGTAVAINCYVCDASDTQTPFQCGEWFERFDDPDIQPEDCSNVHDAKYCIKHVGRYQGGIGAKRFCSSKDLGNYCDYVKNKGDRMDYRSCIYTCSSDGCNGANGVMAPALAVLLVSVLLVRF